MLRHLLIVSVVSTLLSLPGLSQDVVKLGAIRYIHATGPNNTGVGFNAGANLNASNQSSVGNTFIGFYAGFSNNLGGNNTYVGDVAGYNTTSGSANVAVGRASGYNITTGIDNTFLGAQAGNYTTQGNTNTFLGRLSGTTNTTGSNNIFVGFRAGGGNTIGTNNVYIGNESASVGPDASNLQNAVALGTKAKVAISNAIILGDTANTSIKVGIGTAAPNYTLDVKGSINIRGGSGGPGQLLLGARTFLYRDEQDYLVLAGGNRGESGLRFANLSNQFSPANESRSVLSVDEQGRVGLYRVCVDASQVRLQVASTSQWADYVFSPFYKLPSIADMRAYINANKHLPNIPSAEQMVTEGSNAQELIKDLVKTQEEQALYIIQLKEENDRLGVESNQLQQDVAALKLLVEQLLKK